MIETAVQTSDVCAHERPASRIVEHVARDAQREPTVWGLSLIELHDRYWAALGVRVIRSGGPSPALDHCRLFLLLEPAQLVLFERPAALNRLRPRHAGVVQVEIQHCRNADQRESVRTTDDGVARRILRHYAASGEHSSNVYYTNDARVAETWRRSVDAVVATRSLRSAVSFHRYFETEVHGWSFDSRDDDEAHAFQRRLLAQWNRPDAIDPRLRRGGANIWMHESSEVADFVRFIGPVWIGAGVTLEPGCVVVGPHVIEDAVVTAKPPFRLERAVPTQITKQSRFNLTSRRIFDIAFSLLAVALAAPLWPIIAAAIWIDDGWPILFRHRRQTIGGREFDCLKFRTMRRDADAIKAQLQAQNVCDGPQFYIENDPRETRVGRLLRRFHLDELPQFLNVLAGDMSIVGPRPSPESENQYCPAWRATRLSVKPGITGLWQVRRTRELNADFQEWIRYDTEYVRRRNWWMDLCIIAATLRRMLPI